jgi:hypothetical protein
MNSIAGSLLGAAKGKDLLGAAEHGRRFLDHLEVDVKHNETSHFSKLPAGSGR